MLDIDQDTSDDTSICAQHNSHSHHDLNISRALSIVLNDLSIDGMTLINVIRVAMGHRVLLSKGGNDKRFKYVVADEDGKDLNEDEEIEEILEEIK